MEKITIILSKGITFVIKLYQYWISPLLGPRCRFYPSCSSYTIEAIQQHGLLKGFYLSFKRILHCHPASKKSGIDLVPEKKSHANHFS